MKIFEMFIKNKKYLIFLVSGIILLLLGNIPSASKGKTETIKPVFVDENKLVKTLEQIEGAGRVKVFISYKNDGERQIAQKISKTEKGTEISPEDSDGSFYVLSVNTPEITGVLITASGANNTDVKERILRGTKHALGVPYHKISVEWGK